MEWSEVIDNPLLQDLPFKIELNKFGKLLMSPVSNEHGRIQSRLAAALLNQLSEGEVITVCSIQTSDGVKVADVAWLSTAFIHEFDFVTPFPKAPEICIEIVSPSISNVEIQSKIDLYLAKGANEVWIVYSLSKIHVLGVLNKATLSVLNCNQYFDRFKYDSQYATQLDTYLSPLLNNPSFFQQ